MSLSPGKTMPTKLTPYPRNMLVIIKQYSVIGHVRRNTLRVTLSCDSLDVALSSCARPHAVGDGSGEGGEVGEVGVGVDGVEVARNLGVWLDGGGRKSSSGGSRERIALIGERGKETLCLAVTLKICHDQIAIKILPFVLDRGDLVHLLELIACVHFTDDSK